MASAGGAGVRRRGVRTFPIFRRAMFVLRFITQLRSWYIMRELRVLLRRSGVGSMLDAGCGYGEYSYFVASRHPEVAVTSLEVDVKLAGDFGAFVERVGVGNVRVVAGDVLGLTDRDRYDLVLCGSVLEHIEEDEKALANLVASVRPGGTILIYVPTAPRRYLPHYRAVERRADSRAGGSQYGHVRDYTRSEIEEKIARAGLTLRKGVATYGFFGAVAFEILYTFLPHSSRFSRRHWLILPPYFVLLHPFVMVLMLIDLLTPNKRGNGFMGVCVRHSSK
jgi:SAM-dependent methyltransferase